MQAVRIGCFGTPSSPLPALAKKKSTGSSQIDYSEGDGFGSITLIFNDSSSNQSDDFDLNSQMNHATNGTITIHVKDLSSGGQSAVFKVFFVIDQALNIVESEEEEVKAE